MNRYSTSTILFTILVNLFFFAPLSVKAQRNCKTHEHLQNMIEKDPSIKETRKQIEVLTAAFVKANGGIKSRGAIYNIPVVVHVLYNSTLQNITDAQVLSQMAVLNADFQKLNPNFANTPTGFQPFAADNGIQFCLASKDPNGNATTGITRTYTAKTAFDVYNDDAKYNSMGGRDAWNRDQYLNIWVVPNVVAGTQSGILGYAQYPGGTAATDGVVIGYRYFGTVGTAATPFNGGRTATHEVGHWLNLYHIWGDDDNCTGSDLVSDTPNQGVENYGCPSFPSSSCTNGSMGDMFMNYMDYTNDACMSMFTNGQRLRMQAILAPGGPRAALATSSACGSGSTTPSVCAIPNNTNSQFVYETSTTISWDAVYGASSYLLQYKPSASSTWSSIIVNNTSIYTLTNLNANTKYDYQIRTNCSSALSSSFSAIKSFTTLSAASVCNIPAALTASNATTNGAQLSWGDLSNTQLYTVQYKTATASTWTTVSNINTRTATLTNLLPNTQYFYQIKSNCSATSSSAYSIIATFKTLLSTNSCNDLFESNNTSITAKKIAANATTNALIGIRGDIDWFVFNNAIDQPNIKITLTGLPADYDIKLYGPDGRQVATSEQIGTKDELIRYNSTTIGAYKIKIMGYNGAFDANVCYALQILVGKNAFRENGLDTNTPSVRANIIAEDDVQIYPNPSIDYINIVIPEAKLSADVSARILNQTGSVICNFNYGTSPELSIDVDDFPSGIYFLQIKKGAQLITKRFVVAR